MLLALPANAQTPTTTELLPQTGPERPVDLPTPTPTKAKVVVKKSATSIRANNAVSAGALADYLKSQVGPKGTDGSPLAPHAALLLESPHWSTIIGICTIEQYNCTRAPANNYWGIMCGKGVLCKYATLEEGIRAISTLLEKYESRGKDTLEELNGYYVVPASNNWYNTVLKTKLKVENL